MKVELAEVQANVEEKMSQNEEVQEEVTTSNSVGLKEHNETIEQLNVEVSKVIAENEVLVR